MQPDDKICYCYHVSMRKLVSFARRVRPSCASRMTECLGAGTGCGWCIPFLVQIAKDPDAFTLGDLTPDDYAGKRKNYINTQPRNVFDDKSKDVEDKSKDVEEAGKIPPDRVSESQDS